MTIRYSHCEKCCDRGWYYLATPIHDNLSECSNPSPLVNFIETKESCNCPIGLNYQVWLNRSSHPEYENPLDGLSIEEVFNHMRWHSLNMQAIRQEFE